MNHFIKTQLVAGYCLGTKAIRPVLIKRWTKAAAERKLHLGCGPNLIPGWLNTDLLPKRIDVVYLDATRSFPFADASIDCVFSEHMIEHIPFQAALPMMRECFRVLRPSGWLRIATPDLRAIASLAYATGGGEQRRYVAWAAEFANPPVRNACGVVNQFFYGWGHRFIFDEQTLSELMRSAGFRNLSRTAVGESANPSLAALESHGQSIGAENNEFETLVMEGRR